MLNIFGPDDCVSLAGVLLMVVSLNPSARSLSNTLNCLALFLDEIDLDKS